MMLSSGTYSIINSKILNNYFPNNSSGIRSGSNQIDIYNSFIAKNYGWACLDYGSVNGSIINSTIADNPDGSFAFNDSYIQVRMCKPG